MQRFFFFSVTIYHQKGGTWGKEAICGFPLLLFLSLGQKALRLKGPLEVPKQAQIVRSSAILIVTMVSQIRAKPCQVSWYAPRSMPLHCVNQNGLIHHPILT